MSAEDLISVQNVFVTYPNGTKALDDISVSLPAGKICGLVGMNGSGKSTLYKTIMGFIKPTRGTVTVAGMEVRQALQKNLISYVPQTEEIDWNFPVLVKDVVMMGRYGHMGFLRRPQKADHEAVLKALERVNMAGFRMRQIGELSGGQKKRVFLARALAQGSRIVLLDEPFTGVDVQTEESIIELMRNLRDEGRLILVSTHNLGSVPDYCDRVILINKKLIAAGPVETTFTRDNLAQAFGGMLRHISVRGDILHKDKDERSVMVVTDDERPLVYYGDTEKEKLIKRKKKD